MTTIVNANTNSIASTTTSAFAIEQNAIYLGRNGKAVGAIIRKDGKSAFKEVQTSNVLATLVTGVTKYIDKMVSSGLHRIDVVTLTSVAISYRSLRGLYSQGLTVEEAQLTMASRAFFAVGEEDSAEMASMKRESTEAMNDFVEVVFKALDNDVILNVVPSSDFGKLFINANGQTITDGLKTTFTSGTSPEGFTIYGWKTFSRENATIHVDAQGRGYLRASNSNFTLMVEDAIKKLWALCPEVKPEFDPKKAAEADLF